MESEHDTHETPLFGRWVRATVLGWWLGMGILVALVVVWDLVGGGAQFMVGVGMGSGVGYIQSRLLRKHVTAAWHWWGASTIGMGSPFIVHDLLSLAGTEFSLLPYAVAGGILAGLLQCRLFRSRSRLAGWWVLASGVGWTMPVAAIALGDARTFGPWGQLVSLGGIFGGGLLLGAISGGALVWILGRPAVAHQFGGSNPEVETGAR